MGSEMCIRDRDLVARVHKGEFKEARERYDYFLSYGFLPKHFEDMLDFCRNYGLGPVDLDGSKVSEQFPATNKP